MKVWEVMHQLSKMPAGAEVICSAYPGGTLNDVATVRYEDDCVKIEGNGEYRDDLIDAARHGVADDDS